MMEISRFAIQSFALDHGISPGLADWLLPILNLTSILGRTIPNWLADRYGLFQVLEARDKTRFVFCIRH